MSVQQGRRVVSSQYIVEQVNWDKEDMVRSLSRKEEKVEYLQGLLKKEEQFYEAVSTKDFAKAQVDFPPSWRSELCNWAYSVVDHFGLDRQVVSCAMNYLDLVTASPSASTISKNDYVLLAVSSLHLAAKEYASDTPGSFSLGRDRLAELCQGAKFQTQDIENAERFVLAALNGASHQPSSQKFLAALARLCPGWQRSQDLQQPDHKVLRCVYDVARHLVEVSFFEANLNLEYKPSVVAYAAILCAIEALQPYLPVPHFARVRLLNNVAEAAANLLPARTEVLQVVQTLKDACPKMFEGDELITQFLDQIMVEEVPPTSSGRSSPVGVLDR